MKIDRNPGSSKERTERKQSLGPSAGIKIDPSSTGGSQNPATPSVWREKGTLVSTFEEKKLDSSNKLKCKDFKKRLHDPSTVNSFRNTPIIGFIPKTIPGYPTSELVKKSPAWKELFVRGPDGEVRRYPASDKFDGNYKDQLLSGQIYDGYSKNTTKRIAGYQVGTDGSLQFHAHGKPSKVLRFEETRIFPLANRRHLVEQPGFRDCTFACELMMLMDRSFLHKAEIPFFGGNRREIDEVAKSLQHKTGLEPLKFEQTFVCDSTGQKNARPLWRQLSEMIKQHGPCIAVKPPGHEVMIDEVREDKGKFFLTIRDPFHCTCKEIEAHSYFTDGEKRPKDYPYQLKAIFLPENQASSSSTERPLEGSHTTGLSQQSTRPFPAPQPIPEKKSGGLSKAIGKIFQCFSSTSGAGD